MKDENFQRSASAPVGMVAAVSMKTVAKRNIARLAGSCATLTSANFAAPNRPAWPIDTSYAPGAAPPRVGQARTPPSMRPYPRSQNPIAPTG